MERVLGVPGSEDCAMAGWSEEGEADQHPSPTLDVALPSGPGPGVIDWRTLDPSTIRGDGVPVEELHFYQEHLEGLLRAGEGRYVLIVGRDVIAFFDNIEAAAGHAEEHYRDKAVLIKRVVASGPIHTLGGASAGQMVESGGVRG